MWSQSEDAEMGIKTQMLVRCTPTTETKEWRDGAEPSNSTGRWNDESFTVKMSSAAFHLAAITSVFWQKCDSQAFYDSAMPMIFHLAFKMQVRRSFGQHIKDNNIF